ncbi:glutaredoxin family protein [Thalassotalea mangrovi]|uniref:Glutaredoxin family protein n=1 Tax=Thalassotalea mangrovi TaxID=2572245 RepID=A0A4U1B5V2_9GAMM|nr:glutaredoxin family protein [Thalassotalea mangrovi]TKB45700.1 glutaredoxin family protein [Thalassotalea mangrovi]
MQRVVLYTRNRCPHCDNAKAFLDKQQITYRLCNVSSPAGQKEFYKTGFRSVPVLKIGDRFIQGFSLKQYARALNT